MRFISAVFLLLFLTTSCGSMQTPFQTAANFNSSSLSSLTTNHAEIDTRDPETKSDKTGIIILATIVGVFAVAGVVVPLVLIK